MIDPTVILTDVTVHVVDVASPYAHLDPATHLAAFGRLHGGPDWRFEITWPDGAETRMHAEATAANVAALVAAELESRRA